MLENNRIICLSASWAAMPTDPDQSDLSLAGSQLVDFSTGRHGSKTGRVGRHKTVTRDRTLTHGGGGVGGLAPLVRGYITQEQINPCGF